MDEELANLVKQLLQEALTQFVPYFPLLPSLPDKFGAAAKATSSLQQINLRRQKQYTCAKHSKSLAVSPAFQRRPEEETAASSAPSTSIWILSSARIS
jgi:hypothetical protein